VSDRFGLAANLLKDVLSRVQCGQEGERSTDPLISGLEDMIKALQQSDPDYSKVIRWLREQKRMDTNTSSAWKDGEISNLEMACVFEERFTAMANENKELYNERIGTLERKFSKWQEEIKTSYTEQLEHKGTEILELEGKLSAYQSQTDLHKTNIQELTNKSELQNTRIDQLLDEIKGLKDQISTLLNTIKNLTELVTSLQKERVEDTKSMNKHFEQQTQVLTTIAEHVQGNDVVTAKEKPDNEKNIAVGNAPLTTKRAMSSTDAHEMETVPLSDPVTSHQPTPSDAALKDLQAHIRKQETQAFLFYSTAAIFAVFYVIKTNPVIVAEALKFGSAALNSAMNFFATNPRHHLGNLALTAANYLAVWGSNEIVR
jgi:chromosome segregation ATPase